MSKSRLLFFQNQDSTLFFLMLLK